MDALREFEMDHLRQDHLRSYWIFHEGQLQTLISLRGQEVRCDKDQPQLSRIFLLYPFTSPSFSPPLPSKQSLNPQPSRGYKVRNRRKPTIYPSQKVRGPQNAAQSWRGGGKNLILEWSLKCWLTAWTERRVCLWLNVNLAQKSHRAYWSFPI